MLFNSIPFIFFFAVVYTIYWNIPKKLRQVFLTLSGIAFYAYYSVPLLIHFVIIIVLNYYLYYKIHTTKTKLYASLAVILNLVNLGFFKYFYFFTNFLGDITRIAIFKQAPDLFHIALPLAISFYSFQMIAAAVDEYRKPSQDLITFKNYLSFVLFFPVLIAGPIMRTNDFFPNFTRVNPEKDQIYRACYLMVSGLIKKVLIADPIALIIAPVYANPNEYSALTIAMAAVFYAFQVYADFSGLTDMARSVALFLGFEIPENFYGSFFSTSARELWKRWHATLSFWLRDYIYFPLGGSRKGEFRTYINLLITMTLGGLWHGANYTYVAWGAYWGILLGLERYLEDKLHLPLTPKKSKVLMVIKAMIVFCFFSFSALMFRANNAESMIDLIVGVFSNNPMYLQEQIMGVGGEWLIDGMGLVASETPFLMNTFKTYETVIYMFILIFFFQVVQYKPETMDRFRKYDPILVPVLGVLTIFMLALLSQGGETFIYYQF
ncbi:MAG: MBOAT family protein [Leptospiraceae bacterium]|nr:MBOAT family protein [Leptospiraceae bacterium]MCP5496553.1 MBOAT family protein [Leptospiraceae bacterium]